MNRRTSVSLAGSRSGRRIIRYFAPGRRALMVVALLAFVVAGLLRLGGHILTVSEPLPERADIAIVLSGSEAGNVARIAGAMRLLEDGKVARVMLSVGAVTYYGEWLPDIVRRYVKREYEPRFEGQIAICEVRADSTAAELTDITVCLQSTAFESAVVVTSNYHTRRTRMIIRSNLVGRTSVESFAVFGVADGTYEPDGWWQRRRYAKTWLLEMTKLGWFLIEWALPGGDV